MNCGRCETNGRAGVAATTRMEYRETSDYDHWPNRETFRCDECARALRDYFAVMNRGGERFVMMVDERIGGDATYEVTRPMFGDRTHLRVAGEPKTLCGVKSFGRSRVGTLREVFDYATCRRCRKAAK